MVILALSSRAWVQPTMHKINSWHPHRRTGDVALLDPFVDDTIRFGDAHLGLALDFAPDHPAFQ